MTGRFLTTATGSAPGDHVCWPFHGAREYATTVAAYVQEGLRRGEQVTLVDIGGTGVFDGPLTGLGGDGGRPVVDPDLGPARRYEEGRVLVLAPPVPPASLPTGAPEVPLPSPFDAWIRAAHAGGYSGLRVMSNATEMVRDPVRRGAYLRSEHRLSRAPRAGNFSLLCGYDVDELGPEVAAAAAAVHPLAREASSSFLLRALPGDGRAALTGEVDGTCADLLHAAVGAAVPAAGGVLLLDVSELGFIEHRGLLALEDAARAAGVRVALVGASPLVGWLVDALALTRVTSGPSTVHGGDTAGW